MKLATDRQKSGYYLAEAYQARRRAILLSALEEMDQFDLESLDEGRFDYNDIRDDHWEEHLLRLNNWFLNSGDCMTCLSQGESEELIRDTEGESAVFQCTDCDGKGYSRVHPRYKRDMSLGITAR